MRYALWHTHILSGGVAERDHKIVPSKIKRASREWIERKEHFIPPLYRGNLGEKRCNLDPCVNLRGRTSRDMHEGKDISVRIYAEERLKAPLPSSHSR
jgi:hypothetical protein